MSAALEDSSGAYSKSTTCDTIRKYGNVETAEAFQARARLKILTRTPAHRSRKEKTMERERIVCVCDSSGFARKLLSLLDVC